MDPHAEQVPGLALPKPSSEQGAYDATPYRPGATPETVLPAVESGPISAGTSAGQVQAPIVPPQLVSGGVPVSTPLPVAPAQAADDNADALDEEWINKAKAIVEQTKHDPHLESQELGRVKADYLRIRYNRHIKVAEDRNK